MTINSCFRNCRPASVDTVSQWSASGAEAIQSECQPSSMPKPVLISIFVAAVLMVLAATAMAGQTKVVVLDECDPNTFNPALGNPANGNVPCLNVGGTETLSKFMSFLPTGDPLWLFFPMQLKVDEGDTISVNNQGGENHTFTEVTQFGNGFVPGLNNPTGSTNSIPECRGGFSNNDVAATRVAHGTSTVIRGLKPGTHLFECCIHPWMRMEIDVEENHRVGGEN